MPAKSGKQYRFMAGIAHGMKPHKGMGGPSEAVAEEFVKKTSKKKRSKWSKSPAQRRKNHDNYMKVYD